MRDGAPRIYEHVRNFLGKVFNKEFLIFLFFLFVSAAFWIIIDMNDTYEVEVSVPVSVVNVPKGVVVTSDMDDTVKVVVRDKGYVLFAYRHSHFIKPMLFDYQNYSRQKDRGTVTASDLQKHIYQVLANSSRIVSVKPDHLDFYYTQGQEKTVPVKVYGTVEAGSSYYIAKMEVSPETVNVFARKELLDSVTIAFTEAQHITDLTDTITRTMPLRKVKGVKFEPSVVKVTIYPDVLTESKIEVPVTVVNLPADKILRIFPSRVKVTFAVGATSIRDIKPDQFQVEADYEEVLENNSEKCPLRLVRSPFGVRNAQLDITEADYLIEEQ